MVERTKEKAAEENLGEIAAVGLKAVGEGVCARVKPRAAAAADW